MITCPETEAATTAAVDGSECESIGDIKASAIEHQTMRAYVHVVVTSAAGDDRDVTTWGRVAHLEQLCDERLPQDLHATQVDQTGLEQLGHAEQ